VRDTWCSSMNSRTGGCAAVASRLRRPTMPKTWCRTPSSRCFAVGVGSRDARAADLGQPHRRHASIDRCRRPQPVGAGVSPTSLSVRR